MVVDIDEAGDARAGLRRILRRLLQPRPGEVADDLGAVLVAARLSRGVDLRQQVVLDRDRNPLHRLLPRSAPVIVLHGFRDPHSCAARKRSALPTTLTEDNAIAAAAMIGDSRM